MTHVPTSGAPAVSAGACRAYEVPTDQPEADGTLAWSSTDRPSRSITTYHDATLRAQVRHFVKDLGATMFKLKIGESSAGEEASSDDLDGLREVHDQVPADVAAGEHGYDLTYFHDHARLDPLLFSGTSTPGTGVLSPGDEAPGHGYELHGTDTDRYRVA